MPDLVVTLTETLTLDTGTISSTRAETIGSIVDAYKRIVTCPANVDTTIATFDAAISDATTCPFDIEAVKYIRITNLDGTNPVNIQLVIDAEDASPDGTADSTATIKIGAGQSWIHWDCDASIVVDDDGTSIVTALGDLASITIDPSANKVKVEVFIASLTAA